MIVKQGEIYLVSCDPSVGHEFQKARPAVVISSDALLKKSNLVIVMTITSRNAKVIQDDIFLEADAKNRLKQNSVIKTHHINAFDKKRILHYIGYVNEEVMQVIKQCIEKHFDL